jgi:hypothetical protein
MATDFNGLLIAIKSLLGFLFSSFNLQLREKPPFGCPFFRKNNLSSIHKQVFIRYNGSINSKEESL